MDWTSDKNFRKTSVSVSMINRNENDNEKVDLINKHKQGK